ncbi:hypothetical protein J2W21_003018 [Sinomonas atrocyanea]|uniref:hypothetical protein n=1 Tax=Sinomonas atrocyanea TaxID=37927 RepID=UPI00278AF828|nr:hypothetical protein [Sinomonas atrocyanea]MDP9885495.1 hypothetical protein [Sinomonas atrocyanea]
MIDDGAAPKTEDAQLPIAGAIHPSESAASLTPLSRLSDEAAAAHKTAVNAFSYKLETTARLIADKREMVLAEHIQDAEGELLSSRIGTAISTVVAWLRPTAFFFLGLMAPAITSAIDNKPVQPGQFAVGLIGGVIWGSAAALDFQSARIKRWWRRRGVKKSAAKKSAA